MTTVSLSTGSRSGKSTQNTPLSIPGRSLLLTTQVHQFLAELAPRAYPEAILQAALSKVTVDLSWHQATSGVLTARTIFSTLTRLQHYKGLMLARSSQDSRFFQLRISETVEPRPFQLLELWRLSDHAQTKHFPAVSDNPNRSVFHVLISQETMNVELLQLPAQLSGRFRASL
jgi:hypothetical protein